MTVIRSSFAGQVPVRFGAQTLSGGPQAYTTAPQFGHEGDMIHFSGRRARAGFMAALATAGAFALSACDARAGAEPAASKAPPAASASQGTTTPAPKPAACPLTQAEWGRVVASQAPYYASNFIDYHVTVKGLGPEKASELVSKASILIGTVQGKQVEDVTGMMRDKTLNFSQSAQSGVNGATITVNTNQSEEKQVVDLAAGLSGKSTTELAKAQGCYNA